MRKTIWRFQKRVLQSIASLGHFFQNKKILGMGGSPIFWSASGEMSPQKKLLIMSDIKEV
jgi:hypothetical protein